jgi:hypothetical protein
MTHDPCCTQLHTAHTTRAALDPIRMADPTHPDYVGLPLLERIAMMRQKGNEHLCPITPNEVLLLADVATAWVGLMNDETLGPLLMETMRVLADVGPRMGGNITFLAMETCTPDLTIGFVALREASLSGYDASRPHPYMDPSSRAGRKWMGDENLRPYPSLCQCAAGPLAALREEFTNQLKKQRREGK